MGVAEIEAVQVYRGMVDGLLDRAAQVKPNKQIEPPVTEALLGESIWRVPEQEQGIVKRLNQQTQLAAVEIAFREKFYRILVRARPSTSTLKTRANPVAIKQASTSIDEPGFVQIWNLLDIVSIFSDNGQWHYNDRDYGALSNAQQNNANPA